VERVTDGHKLEWTVQGDGLSRSDYPSGVDYSARIGLGPGEVDCIRLLINRHHLGKVPSQGEGDLAGAACEIEQPATA
jgi:hypothetical protein